MVVGAAVIVDVDVRGGCRGARYREPCPESANRPISGLGTSGRSSRDQSPEHLLSGGRMLRCSIACSGDGPVVLHRARGSRGLRQEHAGGSGWPPRRRGAHTARPAARRSAAHPGDPARHAVPDLADRAEALLAAADRASTSTRSCDRARRRPPRRQRSQRVLDARLPGLRPRAAARRGATRSTVGARRQLARPRPPARRPRRPDRANGCGGASSIGSSRRRRLPRARPRRVRGDGRGRSRAVGRRRRLRSKDDVARAIRAAVERLGL